MEKQMVRRTLQKCPYIPEAAAKKALGRNYWPVAKFFLHVFSRCAVLQQSGKAVLCAFVTRRCHVLSLIFLEIFSYYRSLPPEERPRSLSAKELDSLADLEESCFITDFNLIYMGEEIADYYLKQGDFPAVVLVDEILIHGRAVNRVLRELEHSVLQRIGEAAPETGPLRNRLLEALELRVFAQKEGPQLLLLRFQRRLQAREVCPVEQLREYSRQFALLVSVSNYNNAAYSWSLHLPAPQAGETGPSPFYETTTSLSGIRQTSFLWYYPSPERAKAVCTIRWRENQVSDVGGQRLAVPFILFGDIPAARLLELHERILHDLEALDLQFLRGNENLLREDSETGLLWVSETNDLVLSSLLSRRFWGKNLNLCEVDWDAVARNYIGFSEAVGGGAGGIREELKRLWAWEDAPEGLLEDYLALLLEDSDPMWDLSSLEEPESRTVTLPESETRELTRAVEDAIASIAYEAERSAYEKYAANISLSERAVSTWETCDSLRDVLRDSFAGREIRVGIPELSYAIGVILQRMDLALISMRPCTGEGRCFTMLQAGEQALFIKPIRYQKYIPVLSMIKRRCGSGQRELGEEIRRFVSGLSEPEPNLAEELCSFVQDLDYVHQDMDKWDIPLSIQLERRTDKAGNVTLEVSDDYHQVLHEQITCLMEYAGI